MQPRQNRDQMLNIGSKPLSQPSNNRPYLQLFLFGTLDLCLSVKFLGHLPLSSPPAGLWTTLGIQEIIPPSERAGVIADESLVVRIMMISTSPEWQKMVQAPWEFVSRVRINSLEKSEHDPDVHCKNVKIARHCAPENWRTDGAETENHDFDGGSVFSC